MATLVAFHAHPDDERMSQSGTLAKAAAARHHTVVVYATGGEAGQVAGGFLDAGETLVERRWAEAERSTGRRCPRRSRCGHRVPRRRA
jgi:LmbE family N-acetylglucosaminyl deacetylase